MSDFLSSVIPVQPLPATLVNPRTLVIYSDLKVGKTAIASALSHRQDVIWVDLEDGSGGLPGKPVNVVRKAAEMQMPKVDFFQKLCGELEKAARYRYMIVDKIDHLETWSNGWAWAAYCRTTIGKDAATKYSSIEEVPYIGWGLWHEKFQVLWNAAKAAAPHVIFFGSLKMGTGTEKFGKHDQAQQGLAASFDLDLGSRQKKTAVGDSDATALMWREVDGANWLSFASREKGAFTGCRIPRLEGKRFRFSWLERNGSEEPKVVVDWAKLFVEPPAPAPDNINTTNT